MYNIPPWGYIIILVIIVFIYNNKQGILPNFTNKSLHKGLVQVPIDLNGNDRYARFIGTDSGKPDRLMVNVNGTWSDIIDQTNLSSNAATYSAAVADINNNGLSDLIVARSNGVWAYLNNSKGRFEVRKLSGANDPTSSISISDYNRDGHVDIYLTQKDGKNILLEGIGRGVFEDVTDLTKTQGSSGNVSAAWVDVNGDDLPDLVLGKDDGGTEIYRNTRGASGMKFTSGPLFFKEGESDLTMTEQLNRIASSKQTLHPGRKGADEGGLKTNYGTRNWIAVKLPDNNQFLNATIRVVSVDESTGKITRQSKQNVKDGSHGEGNNAGGKVVTFDLGMNNRVMNLEVQTIYDGTRWIHPDPKINKIATFRDFKSNNYTAK